MASEGQRLAHIKGEPDRIRYNRKNTNVNRDCCSEAGAFPIISEHNSPASMGVGIILCGYSINEKGCAKTCFRGGKGVGQMTTTHSGFVHNVKV
jgi:hypothetical protein